MDYKLRGEIECDLVFDELGLFINLISKNKDSLSHKVVTLNLPLVQNCSGPGFIFFDASSVGLDGSQSENRCLLMARFFDSTGQLIDAGYQKQRFLVDNDKVGYCLPFDFPENAFLIELGFYQDKAIHQKLSVQRIGIINSKGIFSYRQDGLSKIANRITKKWYQNGNTCFVETPLGVFYCVMPSGWSLDRVPLQHLLFAEFLLFGEVERRLFNIDTYGEVVARISSMGDIERKSSGAVMHAFSGGADSVAAAKLLPDDTVNYFSWRDYSDYRDRAGYKISIQPQEAYNKIIDDFNALVLKNTFEKIGISYGEKHGYRHGLGYGALGALLADQMGGRALSFGTILEVCFMRKGYSYVDTTKILNSGASKSNNLFMLSGLDLCYPVGGCSEVVTNFLTTGNNAEHVVSCPNAGVDALPCGVCFKCFRKLSFSGKMPENPTDSVLTLLNTVPLKQGATVIYAIKKSGFRSLATDRYLEAPVEFLERYYPYAIDCYVPEFLRTHIKSKLKSYGVDPMSNSDIDRFKGIASFFDFSPNQGDFDNSKLGTV